jgi:hypothetical protein
MQFDLRVCVWWWSGAFSGKRIIHRKRYHEEVSKLAN